MLPNFGRLPALSLLLASLLPAAAAQTAASSAAQAFKNPHRIPIASDPASVMAGDLNGDARPDLVYGTGQFATGVLHPLLAQADGSYLPGTDISLPAVIGPNCKLADVNADTHLDLLCAGYSSRNPSVAILLGRGDATFQTAIQVALAPTAQDTDSVFNIAAIADINHDGHPDLIVTDGINSIITPLLGDGTGHFTPATAIPNAMNPVLAELQDLNHDGNLDLVTSGISNNVVVYTGHGDGTFTQLTYYPYTVSNVLADVNNDGYLDLICGRFGLLKILPGLPDGTFGSTPILSTDYTTNGDLRTGFGSFITAIAYRDLNGDNIPDILASSTDGLTVLLGQSATVPQFAAPVHYPVSQDFFYQPFLPTRPLLDLNGDGTLDLVAAGPAGLYLTYGNPDGTFQSAAVIPSGKVVAYATTADVNGDHIPDVITSGDSQLHLNLGKGDGTFLPTTAIPTSGIDFSTASNYANAHILHGDFNADGHQDLLAIGSPSAAQYLPYLLLGHGDATFDAPTPAYLFPNNSTTSAPGPMAVVKVTAAGPDSVATLTGIPTNGASYSLTLSTRQPSGLFTPTVTPLAGSLPTTFPLPALADLNADGNLDLAYTDGTLLYLATGLGDGTFHTATTLPLPTSASAQPAGPTVIADLDGDGHADIAVLLPSQASSTSLQAANLLVFYGQADGSFSSPVLTTTSAHSFTTLQSADLDQDGRADLILSNGGNLFASTGPVLGILHGQASRTLSAETNFIAGSGLSTLSFDDLNRDSLPDILAANGDPIAAADAFTVLLNQGTPVTPPVVTSPVAVTGTLTASPEPSTVAVSLSTQAITLTATLTPADSATLTGTVTFTIDGTAAGTGTLANNTVTIPVTQLLAVGTHTLTATWPGDTTHAAASLTGTHVVVAAAATNTTRTSLTSSLNPAVSGAAVTLAAQVLAFTSQTGDFLVSALPTGTVQFVDQFNGTTTLLATQPLTSGRAILTTSTLAVGTHSITAVYSGDTANPTSTSAILAQVITTALPPTSTADFTLTASSPTLSLVTGHHLTFTVTATSTGAFADTLTLSTGNLPYDVLLTPTPATMQLTAGGQSKASFYLDTDAVIGYLSRNNPPAAGTISAAGASVNSRTSATSLLAALAAPFSLLLLVGARRRRSGLRRMAPLAALVIAATFLIATSGCSSRTPDSTPPGTYSLTITATAANTHQTHTLTIPLTVTP